MNSSIASPVVSRRYQGLECPIYSIIGVLAHKWMTDVLYQLWSASEPLRFRELKRRVQAHAQIALSTKEFTARLRTLEEEGIVTRTVFAEVVPHVEYNLTERGQTLMPILYDLRNWNQPFQEADELGADNTARSCSAETSNS